MRLLLRLFVISLLSVANSFAQNGQFFPAEQFSSSLVNDICQDRQGSLWVATDYGLNRFDGYKFQTFLHASVDSTTLCDNTIVSLLNDSRGRLWVGTRTGLDLFNPADETFRHIAFPDSVKPRISSLIEMPDGSLFVGTAGYGAFTVDAELHLSRYGSENGAHYFSRVYLDSQGRLWHSAFDESVVMEADGRVQTFRTTEGNPQAFVEQEGRLYVVCLHGFMVYADGQLKKADVDMGTARGRDVVFSRAAVDASGNVYIGTRGNGLFRMAAGEPKRLENVNISSSSVDVATSKISSILFDKHGNLWLGCHRKGLVMVLLRPMRFQNWSFEGQGIRLGSTVSSVCEGDDGMVWATVQGVGVYGFNAQGRVVAHPQCPDATEFIFRDRQHRYWLGTDDALFSYDPLTGRSRQCLTFDCDRINDMTAFDHDNIYFSAFGRGFCTYSLQTGSVRNFSMNDAEDPVRGRLCNNWILAMMPDKKGRLWMATSSGVGCYDAKTGTFRPFGWQVLLDGKICYSLCETSRGDILIGTGDGLYIYTPGDKDAVLFRESDGLKDKIIYYIVEANNGDLWCSSSQGIWQYDVTLGTFIRHLAGGGLVKKEYTANVGMHTDGDCIFFGHSDGLTKFTPQAEEGASVVLDSLYLTAFRVGEEYVDASTVINGVSITDGKAVSDCNYFTLSYLDNTVSMAFSQFDFEGAMNASLEYRIDNDRWIRGSEGQNEITFAHLQPGTYRFEVRACQRGECSPSRVVIVTVRSPWYASAAAYFVYFLIVLAIVIYLFLMYRRRAHRRLDEEKMKFLINATHDIRSPLTIILAALKKLKGALNEASSTDNDATLDTIERNSQRILNLVNQILDVRKIDKQQMHLHCRQTNLVPFVAGICKMYEFNAKERNITLNYEHGESADVEAWIDRSQFDKVVSNLLSNAFNYTPDGGTISVVLQSTSGNIAFGHSSKQKPSDNMFPKGSFSITVIDTGEGLDASSMNHLFDRFYQGSNSGEQQGTGIGLNLCKMIVDMHHGTITAANRDDGQSGAIFTVTLPLGKSHLKEEEISSSSVTDVIDVAHTHQAKENASASSGASSSSLRKQVLIVDDDPEIGQFVAQELHHYYKFGFASNGREGLKELLMGDYDAVISDVMMPEMDGFTMLRMIKSNMNLSHLPVIMLTSMADVQNRLEGLEHGADAFMAKPFDMAELHLQLDNLIQSRRHLKGKFSGAQQQADKVEQIELKGNDEQLMERIMKAVNKNLGDSDFNVEMLCQEVGISRAQLHRKMKEMTGLSTSDFIRNIRLEQAARLLKEQKVNITQVAYSVGFSNLAHFSTVFRKHFGVAPSEYATKE